MADAGKMLVGEAYLQKYLVDFGNEKMEANWARTERLHQLFERKMLFQQVLHACICHLPENKQNSAIMARRNPI